MSFPPGSVSGHRRIRIGAHTMIGAHVSLAAGMADNGPLAPQSDVVIVIGDRCNIGRNSSIVGIRHIEITFTIPFATAFRYLFSASAAGPGISPCYTWSCTVSIARYGFTALAPYPMSSAK